MANYNDLITAIDSVIKTNNRREITGQLLQNVLNTMVGSLGENYQLAGFATPTTNPHQPDQNVFYVASQAGVYTQFDNIVLGDGISFLMWKNGAWTSQTISNVTQSWVQQNFVSKEWFRKIFRVYDEDGLEIVPNDMDSVVDNIKAMVGLWTNEYLSALGMGRDGGGTTQTLAQLNDVQLGTLENGDALVYNTAIHKWENKQIQTGVDMSVVWAALAANTNEQINASHLATALSGYVTTAALGTALQSYATQSWVNQNFITVEWFDKLFQLYNGTEAVANKISPNGELPVDQTQLNIEAMFGFWTKKYISALGQGDDGSAGVGDVTWTLLAAQAIDNRTIHLSYITDAVNTYLVANNYITTSAISDMATKTWVNNQGYITGSGSCNYATSAGSVAWGNVSNKPNVAIQEADNNLIAHSNEFNFVGSGYSDAVYFNYRTTGGTNGNISEYILGNGAGGVLGSIIHSGNIGSQSVSYATSAGSASSASYANSAGSASYLYASVADNDYIRIQGGSDGSNAGYLEIATADDGTEPIYVRQYTGVFSSITRTLTLLNSSGATELPGDLYVNGGDFWLQETGGQPRMIFHIPDVSWGNLTFKSDGQFYFYQTNTDSSGATVNVGNLYSTGAVSALSDIRHKEIVRNTNLQVEQIAAMRSVIYRKKDSNDNTLYAGSIAQDWQSILPQVVSVADNDEHTQSLQYGVAALIAVITTARKVAEHERRIADLERENERLKEIINNLNVA